MSNIDKTISQYKEFSQLQEFAQAQHTTIVQLSKKIQKLEDERDHLKSLLESSVPLIKTPNNVTSDDNDAEFICNLEISKLREISTQRDLTLEETRRFETYFKIVSQINNRSKLPEKEAEKTPSDALLALVESSDGNRKQ